MNISFEGKNNSHIIDPAVKGLPTTGINSVSVLFQKQAEWSRCYCPAIFLYLGLIRDMGLDKPIKKGTEGDYCWISKITTMHKSSWVIIYSIRPLYKIAPVH